MTLTHIVVPRSPARSTLPCSQSSRSRTSPPDLKGHDDKMVSCRGRRPTTRRQYTIITVTAVLLILYLVRMQQKRMTTNQTQSTEQSRQVSTYTLRDQDKPFVSHIKVLSSSDTTTPAIKSFYDMMKGMDCLPNHAPCHHCLERHNSCQDCQRVCRCYCKHLCKIQVPTLPIQHEWWVILPQQTRNKRRIPRIIHQTWEENLTPDKYPDLSRLQKSFQVTNWDYHFYTAADRVAFLEQHFPAQVLEAYHMLLPGAFKADLFRYCVLIIYGGLYVDVDFLLETNLDYLVQPDLGFVAADSNIDSDLDRNGTVIKLGDQSSCVSNAFIAAAPGHPVLVEALTSVVNLVRRKATILDIEHLYCNEPPMDSLRIHDDLFLTGPCLLGRSINAVLGKSLSSAIVPGTITTDDSCGPILILHFRRVDLGHSRLTHVSENLIVAAINLPLREDYRKIAKVPDYSQTHVNAWLNPKRRVIYGEVGVYSTDYPERHFDQVQIEIQQNETVNNR